MKLTEISETKSISIDIILLLVSNDRDIFSDALVQFGVVEFFERNISDIEFSKRIAFWISNLLHWTYPYQYLCNMTDSECPSELPLIFVKMVKALEKHDPSFMIEIMICLQILIKKQTNYTFVKYLLDEDIMQRLKALLELHNYPLEVKVEVIVTLDSLFKADKKFGNTEHGALVQFDMIEGFDVLESLTTHHNEEFRDFIKIKLEEYRFKPKSDIILNEIDE